MRKCTLTFLVLATALSMALWGCGSNRDSDGTSTAPSVAVSDAASTGNCTVCHSLGLHTEINGIAGQNPDASGLGAVITHDCEACHGGGQYHHGEGPIPYPSPDGERCETCHEQATKVMASKHNADDPENVEMLTDGHDTRYCQRCHTAEGSIAFKSVFGEKDDIKNDIVANGDPVDPGQYEALPNADADGNSVLHNPVCGACHNALTQEMVEVDAAWDPNQNGVSDQFDLCTSCHNYQLNDGTIFGSGSVTSGTAEFYHDTAWYRTIPTTHYDDPLTTDTVEGYVVRKDGASPCFDCHGHELTTNSRYADDPAELTIHTMWAKSGHAGGLLDEVLDAVAAIDCTGSPSLSHGRCDEQTDAAMFAGVTEATGAAWVHYDWDAGNRQSCQMCHTSTGAMNFLSDQDNYDPANNDFSHLEGWSVDGLGTVTSSGQNEMLYCWACHSNAEEGELRSPGAITLAYTVDGAYPTLPDLGNSNVCVNCHSGRGNMDKLLGGATADPAGAAVTGGTKTHYLAAGGTIFKDETRIGYEYGDVDNDPTTDDYADKSYYAHNTLGCAECHMSSSVSHTWEVVEKDDTNVITALNATKCVECHDGEHALFVSAELVGELADIWNGTDAVPTTVTQEMADASAAELEHEAHGYHDALDALAAALTAAGTTPTSSYPYFTGTATDQGHGGAMHNYSYLHHEPGAYAHNRYYAKRLIFDSIDWLDNKVLDNSITLDPVEDAAAIEWLGGDTASGVVASRP